MSAGATCVPASGSAQNFSAPVHYLVSSAVPVSTKDYLVTVVFGAPPKDILTFGLPGNAAVINGTNITLTVPFGTAVTSLAPTYTLSARATCVPASGSAQNFSAPVHYIVSSAAPVSTKDYLVTVVFGAPPKDILTFGLPGNAAVINGTNITLTVPFGTAVTSLAPTYTLSAGATCVPTSGSSQNFSTPVHYIVSSAAPGQQVTCK